MKQKKKRLATYLRTYRRRWGLTQKELAYLLGCKSGTVVSRLESQKNLPSVKIVRACLVVFGTAPGELFAGLMSDVDKAVMARVWDLYERLQGNPSKTNRTKLELLEDAIARAKKRDTQQDI